MCAEEAHVASSEPVNSCCVAALGHAHMAHNTQHSSNSPISIEEPDTTMAEGMALLTMFNQC